MADRIKGIFITRRKGIQVYQARMSILAALAVCSVCMGVEEVMMPMRDGIRLHTKIWKPEGEGSFPVILTRGYSAGFGEDYKFFNQAGYVYVGQACRGHGKSEGRMNRFFPDAKDGYDCIEWVSRQNWCDGNIAMYGKSFWAATQWLTAPEAHPNLKAIIPQNMNPDIWQCCYRCNGALTLAMTIKGRAFNDEQGMRYGWEKAYRYLPLINLDAEVGGRENKLWNDYVSHSVYDDYWKAIGIREKVHRIKIPVYLMCGWYDYYAGATLRYFEKLQKLRATDEIRVVIDATSHMNSIVGRRDFGPEAAKDEKALAVRWLDQLFKKVDTGIKDEPPLKIFVMGINKWRFENEWPLKHTIFTKYYFHGNGSRVGTLSTKSPRDEPATVYVYDPTNPVPTIGGNHSFLPNDRNKHIIRAGAYDQRPIEKRDDVLVFTSRSVEEDTEVTGPVVVKLYAGSSAPDTDFIAKLIDVYPDGTAYNLTEGIIRARFRKSIWERPELLVPGKIYEYTIELLPTSNVFGRGHSIRVHITSSNFPLWDKNPNTGHAQGLDAELRTARQTIYHNEEYPSHIILPIIPPKVTRVRP